MTIKSHGKPATRWRVPISLRRRPYDEQPTDPAHVLLATTTQTFPGDAYEVARSLVDGQPAGVAVLSIARIHGSSYGFPNPGLMPTRREIQTCRDAIAEALEVFHRDHLSARGQIAITRHELKQIATVARAHDVAHIVLVIPAKPRWRRLVEGDPLRTLHRRVGEQVAVHLVSV
jgi:hypothetical protein